MSNFVNDLNQYLHEALPVVRLRPTVNKTRIYSTLVVLLWIIVFLAGLVGLPLLCFGTATGWPILLILPWGVALGIIMHFGIWYDRKHGIQ